MSNDLFPSDERMPQLSLDAPDNSDGRYASGDVRYGDPNGSTGDPKRVPKRGPGWLAWIIVIGLVGFIFVTTFLVQMGQTKIDAPATKGNFFQPVLMGKLAIGMEEIGKEFNFPDIEKNREQILKSLGGGSVDQRFCVAVLLNELQSVDKAETKLFTTRLEAASAKVEYTKDQKQIETILHSIFDSCREKEPLEVSEPDQAFLMDQLPWFGKLALNPKHVKSTTRSKLLSRAKLSASIFFGGIIFALIVFVVGLITLVIFVAQLVREQFHSRVVDDSHYGPVYIETFALWLVLWLGVSLAIGLRGGGELSMATSLFTMLLPMTALFWPVFRGIPANEMLLDVGLKPVNPIKEMFYGFLAYLAVIPLLAVSLIATTLIAAVQGMFINSDEASQFAPNGVAHPIIGEAFSGNPFEVMTLIFLMACVLAPLTEEIMFRGVLFRHLRDSTSRWRRTASVIVSALISSFIFAAIHPQGLIGIPPLMTLAFAFCLVRQWRGSLVAPMTMHALNNMIPTSIMLPVVL